MARIAICTAEFAPFRGGIATFVAGLATGAKQLGHDVTVIAPDYGEVSDQVDPTHFKIERFRAANYSASQYPIYLSVAAKVRRRGFDRILAADIAFVDAFSILRKAHFDAFVHGSDVVRSPNTFKGTLLATLSDFTQPDTIFANSDYTRGLLLSRHQRVREDSVRVAPLGVDEKWFADGDPAALRRKLNLGHRRLISCVGRLTPRKGQSVLLEAMLHPDLDRDDIALVIAGRPAPREIRYAELLRDLSERVRYGRIVFAHDLDDEEIRSLFAASQLFCLPGSATSNAVEGFGLALLEAAAQGTPSIAGAVAAVPEVIHGGVTGVLVPPDDPARLASAIARLLSDEETRVAMGRAAHDHAKTFGWDRCARIIFGPA